jgi:hypothetical protein
VRTFTAYELHERLRAAGHRVDLAFTLVLLEDFEAQRLVARVGVDEWVVTQAGWELSAEFSLADEVAA